MKISEKIALGFGLFIVLVSLVLYLNYQSLKKENVISDKITSIYTPSLRLLESIERTRSDITFHLDHITHYQTREDDIRRLKLHALLLDSLPNQINKLDKTSELWDSDLVFIKNDIKRDFADLADAGWDILTLLPNFESYVDGSTNFTAMEYYLNNGPLDVLPEVLKTNIKQLRASQLRSLERAKSELSAISDERNYKATLLIGGLIFFGVLISVFVTRSIIKPINQLKETIKELGQGKYPDSDRKITNDEIGEMTYAVNNLVYGLKKTKEFTIEVGKGNFQTDFEPMSQEDELGHALIKMSSELENNEKNLESKVVERTFEMEAERKRATRLLNDLNDSLEYAKRIQTSFLSSQSKVVEYFDDAFIMYKPKDQVSGDFFWAKKAGNKVLVAAVDCTGHGVPGAFVSMVGNNVLNQISKVYTKPSSILNNLHLLSSKVLRKGRENEPMRDGMDIGLCSIDQQNMKLEFSGAYNPCYIIRKGELFQLKGDRCSIGSKEAYINSYKNHEFNLERGDSIYLFSDGYADQFGGPKNKKYLIKKFRKKLISIADLDMKSQELILEEELKEWQGSQEQVDDILVMGIKI